MDLLSLLSLSGVEGLRDYERDPALRLRSGRADGLIFVEQ